MQDFDRLTDPLDIAAEQEDAARTAGIAAIRRSLVGPSRECCIECAEPIAEARRAMGGVIRCLDCQEWAEQKAKRAK